jgi:ketosteroid isomerase-like protein
MLTDLEAAMDAFRRCVEQRDRALAEAVLADDYALVLVQPIAVTMGRSRWLEVLPDYVVHDYDVEETAIDVDGDLAAVLHRDRMTATVLGEDRSGTFVITDVWRRGPDGWKIWRRHSTPLSAGRMPGA